MYAVIKMMKNDFFKGMVPQNETFPNGGHARQTHP
jgi:hypothetical protein